MVSGEWQVVRGKYPWCCAVPRQVARVNGAISDAEMTDLDAEMMRANSGGVAAAEEPRPEPRPRCSEASSAPSRDPEEHRVLSPRAVSPRAPSVHQLLRQLSAAPASKGDGAAAAAAAAAVVVQPALGSDLFEGQLQGRTMASMYVWLAVSLIYYGLSLSAGHMGGGGSLHVNFALSMGVEVPGAAATVLMTASILRSLPRCCHAPEQPDTPATRRVHARPQPFTHAPANPP